MGNWFDGQLKVRPIITIPDEELLRLILDGEIRIVARMSRNPIIKHRGRHLTARLTAGRSHNQRYAVEICRPKPADSKRKRLKRTIARAKLVWMIVNKQLVPEGCHVDHDDGDRLNDSAKNLVARTYADHGAKHGYEPIPA